MELVNLNICKHEDICNFLGIDSNSFVLIQIKYLLCVDLLNFDANHEYVLTYSGQEYLKSKKHHIKEIEKFDYVFYAFSSVKRNESNKFIYFNPTESFDKNISQMKRNNLPDHKILKEIPKNDNNKNIELKHENKPSLDFLKKDYNEFNKFFNSQFPDKNFYDFSSSKFITHKRFLEFYCLIYENKNNYKNIFELRRPQNSTKQNNNYFLEDRFSKMYENLISKKLNKEYY